MNYAYSLDDNNRLLIKRPRLKRQFLAYADGSLAVDRKNRFIYRFREPASWRKQLGLPEQLIFSGKWKLNPEHSLELELDQSKDYCRRQSHLVIKGEIIDSGDDKFVFETQGIDKQGQLHLQIIKLSGFWRSDRYNRLNFVIIKKDAPQAIVLKGAWQLNNNQQIEYVFEKTNLKRKIKEGRTVNFQGSWQINQLNRLTYIVANCVNSYFDFRVQAESPSVYPQEGVIKYRLGTGVRKNRGGKRRVICIFGEWKFSRKAGVRFQVDYGNSRVENIEFGAQVRLRRQDELAFNLTNKAAQPLGLSLVYKHNFLNKDAAALFLKLKKAGKDSGVEAGVNFTF